MAASSGSFSPSGLPSTTLASSNLLLLLLQQLDTTLPQMLLAIYSDTTAHLPNPGTTAPDDDPQLTPLGHGIYTYFAHRARPPSPHCGVGAPATATATATAPKAYTYSLPNTWVGERLR